MLTDAELTQARTMQEGLMVDACTIRRPGGTQQWNDETGQTEIVPHDPHYTGPCRVQADQVQAQPEDVVGEAITLLGYVMAVPWAVTSVQVNDLVTITASNDPQLVGTVLRVVSSEASTFVTARRFSCEVS